MRDRRGAAARLPRRGKFCRRLLPAVNHTGAVCGIGNRIASGRASPCASTDRTEPRLATAPASARRAGAGDIQRQRGETRRASPAAAPVCADHRRHRCADRAARRRGADRAAQARGQARAAKRSMCSMRSRSVCSPATSTQSTLAGSRSASDRPQARLGRRRARRRAGRDRAAGRSRTRQSRHPLGRWPSCIPKPLSIAAVAGPCHAARQLRCCPRHGGRI